ncbi:hypothetical protein PPERSA_09974 [Pseudocohnilembus persalinus]|uniref:Uncharacterized protein n=1 Tax=Pseudocohnilembus persalinus TaxID=266149 RepID=A0A0V0QK28_PSEPJ|nr:hypothetical protein PPERSA_09974 [Pseudocohnilembus persalinus]|eukprot:KRX02357.1 hypothetical protein PPERSA_09974 [Pseudocohnilembus persalinus]
MIFILNKFSNLFKNIRFVDEDLKKNDNYYLDQYYNNQFSFQVSDNKILTDVKNISEIPKLTQHNSPCCTNYKQDLDSFVNQDFIPQNDIKINSTLNLTNFSNKNKYLLSCNQYTNKQNNKQDNENKYSNQLQYKEKQNNHNNIIDLFSQKKPYNYDMNKFNSGKKNIMEQNQWLINEDKFTQKLNEISEFNSQETVNNKQKQQTSENTNKNHANNKSDDNKNSFLFKPGDYEKVSKSNDEIILEFNNLKKQLACAEKSGKDLNISNENLNQEKTELQQQIQNYSKQLNQQQQENDYQQEMKEMRQQNIQNESKIQELQQIIQQLKEQNNQQQEQQKLQKNKSENLKDNFKHNQSQTLFQDDQINDFQIECDSTGNDSDWKKIYIQKINQFIEDNDVINTVEQYSHLKSQQQIIEASINTLTDQLEQNKQSIKNQQIRYIKD